MHKIRASDSIKHNTLIENINMKKTYIQTDDAFNEALDKLKALNPGFSGSVLIRLSVLKMAEDSMRLTFGGLVTPTEEGILKRKKSMPKEDWCLMYGGEIKDGVCTINRYETMPTGHVRRGVRVLAVSAFPVEREDFRQSILGHFETVEEAEEAYKNKPLI